GRPKDEYRKRALPIYRETGDLVGQANVLNNLGVGAYFEGRWDEALELYRESGEVSRRAGDVLGGARANSNAAEILSDQGKLEVCDDALPRAAGVAGTEVAHVGLRRSLGYALVQSRRVDEAREHLEESARLARAMNLDYELALSLKALADTGVAADASVGVEA